MIRCLIIYAILLLISFVADANDRVSREGRVVVAVIDTGFDEAKYGKQVNICDDGHYDPTSKSKTVLTDEHGHGTHVAGLIAKNSEVPYCIVVMKYYNLNDHKNMERSIEAFKRAIKQDVDVINYSGGGISPDKKEKALIKQAIDKSIIVIAAAGNEGKSLEKQTYYPAMYYGDIIVVGNLTKDEHGKAKRAPTSNYGKYVDVQVYGTNIKSINGVMSGTSQSTAIVTGRILKYAKKFRATEAKRKAKNLSRDTFNLPIYKYMEDISGTQ